MRKVGKPTFTDLLAKLRSGDDQQRWYEQFETEKGGAFPAYWRIGQ
jgi:hypothetical protein